MAVLRSLAVVVAFACCAATAAAGSPKDPTVHRVAADVSIAKMLLIAKRDLPTGFRDSGPDKSGSGSDALCKGVVQPDLHRLVMTADQTSHDFDRTDAATGFTRLNNEAGLFRTAGEATESMAWFARLPKATIEACFRTAARSGLPKSAKTDGFRLTVTHRTILDLHLDVWEMGLRVQRNGVWIPVDLAIASYRRGRALDMLLAVNVGPGLDPTLMRDVSATISARLFRAKISSFP